MLSLIRSHQARPADDPIFALAQEAAQQRARGESVINATLGSLLDDEGQLAILPTSSRVIREIPATEWAAYAPIAGSPDFLKAVQRDLFGDYESLHAASTAVATPGGTGALRHAIANYLEPGQALLTTNFYWGPYKTLADESDRKVETFRMFDEAGALDVAALDRAIGSQLAKQGRAFLILNDPCHNPTGYSMKESEWQSVVDRLLAHAKANPNAPVTLLIDMAYAAYGARDMKGIFRAVEPLLGHTGLLFAWSASKTFTHYGLRVGALVACEADASDRTKTNAALTYSCRGVWSNCNRGGQTAITRLLADDALAAACNAERAKYKALLTARVNAFNVAAKARGLVYPTYEGGFFVTVFRDDAIAHAVTMKSHGVFVVPQEGALRVALCSVAERDVTRLVESLAGDRV